MSPVFWCNQDFLFPLLVPMPIFNKARLLVLSLASDIPGLGPVYDGIGHLLLTPEDLIPAIAVALYAGPRGKDPGRRTLFFFPLAWLIGGFAGLMATHTPVFPIQLLSFLLLGGLIAADLYLPDNIINVLVIAANMDFTEGIK